MLEQIQRYFKSLDFLKGIVLAFAMVTPVLFANYYLHNIHIGFSIGLGVLLSGPTDVPGSRRHVILGIISTTILSFSLTLLFGSIYKIAWLVLPLLAICSFLVSYISVFGFRASLISFAGILSITLGFAHDFSDVALLDHAFLMALGGLWYLVLTYIKTISFPKAQTDHLFVKTLEKTAEFLKIRSELLLHKDKREELYLKLYEVQFEINEQHEILRDIILSARSKSGFSNKTRRQQLLFSDLIDILELAVANPIDYENFDEVFKKHREKVTEFSLLINEMANQLLHISKVLRKEEDLQQNDKIPVIFKNIERHIDLYRILVGMPKARKGTLMLLNLKQYQEKQAQNIIAIERVLNNYNRSDKLINHKEADRFITPQDYDLKKLVENFSFSSPIFKHSLRLAITMALGFMIGIAFSMQNPYWILLTIAIIMRPSFGLTKTRSINRVYGTLIGAALATVIILLTQNIYVYAGIAIISLPLAFSLVQLNFRNSAVFITLHVVFLFAIFEPNILSVIKFRIIDTVIGATVSFLATYFIWPSWQFQLIHEYFSKAIVSNQAFMKEIAGFYHAKGEVSTNYKLSRKEAFLSVAELNSAFQRLNQDPKSKQIELSTIYELTVFNNTFLSSLTSLGAYFRNNRTSQPTPEFDVFISNICINLTKAVRVLNGEEEVEIKAKTSVHEAGAIFDENFSKLSDKRDAEIALGEEFSAHTGSQLKETLLVSEQLKWLFKLSEKLVDSSKKYKSSVR